MRHLNRCRKGVLSLALALSPLLLGGREARGAFLGDVLKPFATLSETYDSNIFRVRDEAQLLTLLGDDQLSDFSTVLSVGTELHYELSKQLIDLMLKRDFIRFSHHTSENADRDEANAKLALSVLTKWKLTLDGSYSDIPESRLDFRTSEQNLIRTLYYGATAGYELPLGLTISAGYHRRQVDHSLPLFASSEYDSDIYAGTLTYQISPEAQVYGRYQHERRSYDEPVVVDAVAVPRDNDADSFRVGIDTRFTPRTGVSGYIGYLSRRHSAFPERDFSGFIAGVDGSYALTYKTKLLLSGERQLYEETLFERAYSIGNSLGIGINYQVTEKVQARLFERLTWKDYVELAELDVPERKDFLQELTAGVDWTPIRRLTVSLDYRYSTRSSDEEAFDFTAHMATAAVGYKF